LGAQNKTVYIQVLSILLCSFLVYAAVLGRSISKSLLIRRVRRTYYFAWRRYWFNLFYFLGERAYEMFNYTVRALTLQVDGMRRRSPDNGRREASRRHNGRVGWSGEYVSRNIAGYSVCILL